MEEGDWPSSLTLPLCLIVDSDCVGICRLDDIDNPIETASIITKLTKGFTAIVFVQ